MTTHRLNGSNRTIESPVTKPSATQQAGAAQEQRCAAENSSEEDDTLAGQGMPGRMPRNMLVSTTLQQGQAQGTRYVHVIDGQQRVSSPWLRLWPDASVQECASPCRASPGMALPTCAALASTASYASHHHLLHPPAAA